MYNLCALLLDPELSPALSSITGAYKGHTHTDIKVIFCALNLPRYVGIADEME